jgi:hypothetical protein
VKNDGGEYTAITGIPARLHAAPDRNTRLPGTLIRGSQLKNQPAAPHARCVVCLAARKEGRWGFFSLFTVRKYTNVRYYNLYSIMTYDGILFCNHPKERA